MITEEYCCYQLEFLSNILLLELIVYVDIVIEDCQR